LGQGFPDFPGPATATRAAAEAIASQTPGNNQYSLQPGTARLTAALCKLYNRRYKAGMDPGKNVCVTAGGTEALFATMQAFVDPGDDVVCFEPFFPWYLPAIRMASGTPRCVRLMPPSFEAVEADIRAAITEKTKMLIFNTPHNPTGHCASPDELAMIARICVEKDLLCVSDEVYESCVFPNSGVRHGRLADEPGMAERTITIGSASKLLSLTGWRVGWASGPADLIAAVKTAHSYITYCAPTPLQEGCAAALEAASEDPAEIDRVAADMEARWQSLAAALRGLGVEVCPAQGGYFLVCDVKSTGKTSVQFVEHLLTSKKVAGVPMDVFYFPTENADPCTLVRFAVCKQKETIDAAIERLTEETG